MWLTIPKLGKIRIQTSGWPKKQNKCWIYIYILFLCCILLQVCVGALRWRHRSHAIWVPRFGYVIVFFMNVQKWDLRSALGPWHGQTMELIYLIKHMLSTNDCNHMCYNVRFTHQINWGKMIQPWSFDLATILSIRPIRIQVNKKFSLRSFCSSLGFHRQEHKPPLCRWFKNDELEMYVIFWNNCLKWFSSNLVCSKGSTRH